MSRAELKEAAKISLKGKYKEAIKLLGIFLLISLGISFIIVNLGFNEETTNMLDSIISIVFSGLLYFGYYSFFLKISRNEEVTYNELFKKTNLFWPCVAIMLLTGIFIFLWSLLFIIPGIIASISYSMVYFVYLDNPDLSPMDAISKSKEIMKGHKMDYFILNLSFIGWSILSIFTLGILLLWLIPYMQVTFANFYNKIKN